MYMCTCSGMRCSSNHVCTCTCAHVVACTAVPIMCVHVHVHIDTYTCLTFQCAMHLLCTPSPCYQTGRHTLARPAGWRLDGGTLFPTGGPLCVQTRRVSVWGQLPRRGWRLSLSEATCGGLCMAVRASMFPSPLLPLPLFCPSLHLPPSHRAQEEGLTTCQSWVCWEAVLALPLVPVQ